MKGKAADNSRASERRKNTGKGRNTERLPSKEREGNTHPLMFGIRLDWDI